MNGRAAGMGPVLFGGYLLFRNLPESALFDNGKNTELASALAALGAFLVLLGVIFTIKNLKY